MGVGKELLSRVGSDIAGHSKPFLYERGIVPDHITRLSERSIHAWEIWWRETLTLRRDPTEILHAWSEETQDEPWLTHVWDGVEFIGRMDIADRASNGFRRSLLVNQSTGEASRFGEMLWRAYNNPHLSDHNHEHNRRLERWLESMLLNIGQLRHSDSVLKWIDSAFVYGYFHDIDQLVTLQRNLDDVPTGGENRAFKPKKGHALAAAVMLLATHRRYGEERVIRNRDAWETAAGAAYMCLKHDEPELLSDMLGGRERAFRMVGGERRLLHGDELYEKFLGNTLDLTTIAPSQLVELLVRVKGEHGFVSSLSPFGLHPDFEREYAAELQELSRNKTPLFREISDERKKSLKLATEVAVRADMIEMIAPPVESIFRTLLTDFSLKRPFWRDGITLRQLFFAEGNVDSGDSDTRRILWELLHIDSFGERAQLGKTPYLRRINRDNAVMGLFAFRDIGAAIMEGRFTVIDAVYKHRTWELGRKVLLKTGANPVSVATFMAKHPEETTEFTTYLADIRALAGAGNDVLLERYREKADTLAAEAERLRDSLVAKDTGYTPGQVDAFRDRCDSALRILKQEYGVSDRQLRRYRAKAARGEFPDSTAYSTYDSLGDPDAVRTLIEPLGPSGDRPVGS